MAFKPVQWVKDNKLTTFLIAVVLFLLFKNNVSLYKTPRMTTQPSFSNSVGRGVAMDEMSLTGYAEKSAGYADAVSPTDLTSDDRKMITTTGLSLQVKNVNEVINGLKAKLNEYKGYIVDISITRPELGESATMRFRVPLSKVDESLAFLRNSAIKVVSENISGRDITDQYTDYEMRLTRLDKTKATLEAMLDKATTVEQILSVQNQIFSIQNDIDRYKGKIKYLTEASETTLITAYLSTDEAGLPYTEPLSWRPDIIFKHAVRSLIGTLQSIGSFLIWLGVYSVIIVPAITIVLIIIAVKKKKEQKYNP